MVMYLEAIRASIVGNVSPVNINVISSSAINRITEYINATVQYMTATYDILMAIDPKDAQMTYASSSHRQ